MSDENPAGTEPKAEAAKEAAAKDSRDWSEQLKKVVHAAAGAVNLTQDDMKSFVRRLVEKGEIAKKDGEKLLKQVADRVQQTVKRESKAAADKATEVAEAAADKLGAAANQEKLAEKINASIERMLHGMNIATRSDLDELSKQLDDLDSKVGQLVEAAAQGRVRKPQAAQA